jgi:hypothetical protein
MTVRLPDFLIVGAARCGTSWLAKNIAAHPDVFVPPCKELHFFDRHYERGIEWYQGHFSDRTERRVGEATPAYLYFEHIPALIHQHIPDVKILAILRNPVDRAYSHYWNLIAKARRKGAGGEFSFEEKIESSPRIIDEGLYSEKLDRYYDIFPGENVKVMFYDDLCADPAALLREACGFLGVEQTRDSARAAMRVNASGAKLGRLQAGPWLQNALGGLGLVRLGNWLDRRNGPSLPPVSEATRSLLLERYYAVEIDRLERMFGRDLSSWKT